MKVLNPHTYPLTIDDAGHVLGGGERSGDIEKTERIDSLLSSGSLLDVTESDAQDAAREPSPDPFAASNEITEPDGQDVPREVAPEGEPGAEVPLGVDAADDTKSDSDPDAAPEGAVVDTGSEDVTPGTSDAPKAHRSNKRHPATEA